MDLKAAILQKARALGFQHVGVTTPDPPQHLNVYQNWLSAGHHAGMNWMATDRNRARRGDPRLILPECQSILVLGIHYQPPNPPSTKTGNFGQIASYAWGDDYHDILPARLQAIVSFIENQVGHPIPNRWYTDTGPILERELGQRAGLGWIGKNSCLINPEAGSYFLLAEILLGLELPPDEAFLGDHCGSCNRCVEACPTDCILPNRTIDANRCISYLTIEEKGAIPAQLRSKIGNWVFGCDICQRVCPWNQRFAPASNEKAFSAQPERDYPNLADELSLTPQNFKLKFAGSPIKRTKRRGYLRNAAIALGNSGNFDIIPALVLALSDLEPLVRSHAAWALGQIKAPEAFQALQEAHKSETDAAIQSEIAAAIRAWGQDKQ